MNLGSSKYVLFYRLQGEAENTAHTVLLNRVFEAKQCLTQLNEFVIEWAALLNNAGVIVRQHNQLV